MILLINPNLMKPPVTPVALDYLAQALDTAGISFRVLDLAFEPDPLEAVRNEVTGDEQLVGVSVRNIDDCYFSSQDFCLERTREIIHETKTRTDAPVFVGGIGYSMFPRDALRFLDADAGVPGEGEEVLCDAAHRIRNKRDWRETPGLLLDGKEEDRTIRLNRVSNLAETDLSARQAIDNARYLREGANVGFETKRGCNGTCIFCPEPYAKGLQVRVRDPENVARELENLLRQGVDTFHTCDSEFNLPPDHALAVCEAIIARGLGDRIRWYAYATPHPFHERLAQAMRWAGCVGIDFGVDHADDGMLTRLGRQHRVEHLEETAALCRKHGIVIMYDLLIGGPGESRDSIRQTIEKMKSIAPERVGIAFGARIYPNTPLGRLVGREGFTPENPNLRGRIENNDSFLQPVYYVSSNLGEDIGEFLQDLIAGDERFLFGGTEPSEQNYNYNDNSVLSNAIRDGERGAYWDILRRLSSRST